jgi:hypothetical protein
MAGKEEQYAKKIELVEELTGLWVQLQKDMDEALESPEVSQQLEDRCFKVKTQIAQLSQLASEWIQEYNSHSAVRKVLLGVPTLDLLKGQSPIVISNLRNVWHDAFIALNQLVGSLRIEMEEAQTGGKKKKSKATAKA